MAPAVGRNPSGRYGVQKFVFLKQPTANHDEKQPRPNVFARKLDKPNEPTKVASGDAHCAATTSVGCSGWMKELKSSWNRSSLDSFGSACLVQGRDSAECPKTWLKTQDINQGTRNTLSISANSCVRKERLLCPRL